MTIRYNAPVILTYTLVAMAITLIPVARMAGWPLSSPASFDVSSPQFYTRLFSYVFVHAGWSHLMGNLIIILLVGPLLEEKFSSFKLFEMMLVTSAVTAMSNAALFSSSLVGGSGLAFMLILLASFSDFRSGQVPMTFIMVAVIFIGSEVVSMLKIDQVSQFSHLAGGFIGALYGFFRGGRG